MVRPGRLGLVIVDLAALRRCPALLVVGDGLAAVRRAAVGAACLLAAPRGRSESRMGPRVRWNRSSAGMRRRRR